MTAYSEREISVSMVGDDGKRKRLGVDADWADGKTLYIKSVMEGAIQDWNKEHAGEEVQSGDRIVKVNGKAGDAQAMVADVRDALKLNMRIRREVAVAGEPQSMAVPGLQRAGVPVPGGPPRVVDVLLERRREAEARQAASGKAAKGPPKEDASGQDKTHYTVLGVKVGGDDSEIKKSYRSLVLQWHPDKNPADRAKAEEMIRSINNAYETLGNPLKRAGYDEMLAAVERMKAGIRLETSFIKPRMSIPKEFMLCPLGHPDKFVRVIDGALKVQSRDDVPGVGFKDFFATTKFSLWWLPEVNNMCRLRARDSAGQGVEGGLNLNFALQGEDGEADVELSANQDIKHANVIAGASPYSQGAFRFEGAYWPGRFFSYSRSGALRMASEEGGNVVDFVLVDFSAAYKYMTMTEVLAGAVDMQVQQSSAGYVKLGDLRADLNVRMYFQQMLGSAVWNNKDFESFFEGHFHEWDFDPKKARVRLRSKEEVKKSKTVSKRKAAEEPGVATGVANVEVLQSAEKQEEVVRAVLGAQDDAGTLPASVFAPAFAKLARPPPTAASPEERKKLAAARQIFVSAVASLCKRAGDSGLSLTTALSMHRSLASIKASVADKELESLCREGLRPIREMVNKRIGRDPSCVKGDNLAEVLSVDLDWREVGDTIEDAVTRTLRESSKPLGSFLLHLKAAAAAGRSARRVAEALAKHELRGLHMAEIGAAAPVLLTIAESGVLKEEAAKMLRPPLLTRLPLSDAVEVIAAFAERGVKGDVLKAPLQARVAVAGPGLAAVPPQKLLRLAAAAPRSPVVAEWALGAIAGAASASLSLWELDDTMRLLLLVATNEVAASSSGGKKLFASATEVIQPHLDDLDPKQLIQVVVAAGATAGKCKALLESSASTAFSRLKDLSLEQALMFTQGVLCLGGKHPIIQRLLDFWTVKLAVITHGSTMLPPDDLANLAHLLSLVAPEHGPVFGAIGARLGESHEKLTSAGRGSLAAAFPGGAGPDFPGKKHLLSQIEASGKPVEAAGSKRPPKSGASRSRSRSPRGKAGGSQEAKGAKPMEVDGEAAADPASPKR